MAVDLHIPTTTCDGEMERSHEGGDANMIEAEPPTSAVAQPQTVVYKKGAWSKGEDEKLRRAVEEYGVRNWVTVEKFSGLGRPAKNCRLRWLNYLRPNLKRYPFTPEEEELILHLHSQYGNSWSRIASKLPGRSDNEIKNFWHKRAKKCRKQHLPFYPITTEEKNHQTRTINSINYSNHHHIIHNNGEANVPKYCPDNNNTLPSSSATSIHSQPSTLNLNVVKTAATSHPTTHALSIHPPSPRTLISASQQPQFLPSSTTLSTNHLLPNTTPTSQTQYLNLSPHQTSPQSCQSTDQTLLPLVSIPEILQVPSLWQQQGGGSTSSASPFTPSFREPPTLSFPRPRGGCFRQFLRAKTPLSPPQLHSAANPSSSSFLPTHSSLQLMQWSSPMDSPRSPLKLKLSPGVPQLFPAQMSTQTTDSPVASLGSAFQLKSPTAGAPLSPLKLHLSIPLPSESCLQSNLSFPDSTFQLNSSTAAATIPLSSPQLKPSSCSQDLSPIQPVTVDTDCVIPMNSSLILKTEPPSVQLPATPLSNSFMHEAESDSNLEIMDELREAQARVRFLKKKLRQRRMISKTTTLLNEGSSSESPETTDLCRRGLTTKNSLDRNSTQSTAKQCSRTKNFVGGVLMVNAPLKNSRTKTMLTKILRKKGDGIGISKIGALQVKSAWKENRMYKLRKSENLEREKSTQESIGLEKATQGGNSELFNLLNSQNNANAATNSDSWDNKLRPFQVPTTSGKCLNECSTIEGLSSESSAPLQDNFLFGQRPGIREQRYVPAIDAFGLVYSQSTSTTLVKPGDDSDRPSYLQPHESGYFDDSFSDGLERKFREGMMDGNLATSVLCESSLLLHQYPATADLQDFNYMGGKPMMEHEHLGMGGKFGLKTSGRGNLAESSKLGESNLLLQQYHPAADLLDSSSMFISKQIMEQGSRGGEQFPLKTSAGALKTECTSRDENLMEGSLIDNLWPEAQMVSQDQTLLPNRFEPSRMTHLIESKNWNHESVCSHAGEVPKQEHGHRNTMPEELSSLLEFFPTTIQTLEWHNHCNTIPGTKASDEFDLGLSLHTTSTSQPLITIADYI